MIEMQRLQERSLQQTKTITYKNMSTSITHTTGPWESYREPSVTDLQENLYLKLKMRLELICFQLIQ